MTPYRRKRIAVLSAIGVCCSLAVWISASSAKDEAPSVLVKKPAAAADDGPILPPPSKPAPAAKDVHLQPPNPQKQPLQVERKRPFMRPAEPREPARGTLAVQSEPMPMPPPADAPVGPPVRELDVRPAPPIVYDTDGDARRMYRTGQINLVMVTQNPSDGCYYEIPLCIPACCEGDPIVKGGRGIFGRGVVEYCWPCGFRAIVKFRHVLGDVRVDYEGD